MSGNSISVIPTVSTDRLAALDRAYDEYCRRRESGEAVDLEAFCRRFPGLQSSLRRQLDVHEFLEQNPNILAQCREVPWPEPGQMFLGFSLVRELGRGGLARVFLAIEPALGNRWVALKVSHEGAAEAKTLGRLGHPHIVPINSVQEDTDTGLTGVCMPFLGSATLCDVLDRLHDAARWPNSAGVFFDAIRGAIPESKNDLFNKKAAEQYWRGDYVDGVLRFGLALAESLKYAHEAGVCHRDIKPSNILLANDGRPMLLDFNLSTDAMRPVDRAGGTLPYMAPEQLLTLHSNSGSEAKSIGSYSDVFALGVVLYELLEGLHPFGPLSSASTPHQFREQLLRRQEFGPTPLRRTLPLDAGIVGIVGDCLNFNAANRPSAAELATRLRRASSWHRRGRRFIAGHKRLVAALLLAFGVAAVIAGVALATRDPYSVRQHRAGMEEYRRANYPEAVEHFNRSLEANSTDFEALFARGRARQRLGDYKLALVDFDAAQMRADNGPTRASSAYCLSRLEYYKEAVIQYECALALGYTRAEVYNDLGHCRLLLARHEAAKEALDQAIAANPNLQAPYHNRALVHLHWMLNQPKYPSKEGLEDIRRAIEIGPPAADLFWHAAALHVRAGHANQAIAYLDRAIAEGQDYNSVAKDPMFISLRKDPRFKELGQRTAPVRNRSIATRLLDPISATSE